MNQVLKQDWTSRDFIASTSEKINQLSLFMTRFDIHAREKLATLSTKLDAMEKQVLFLEQQTKRE
jgi:hypothetical protein